MRVSVLDLPSHRETHQIGRDEFAEVKAVKLLRRGRRLQQAEYVISELSLLSHRMLIVPGLSMARFRKTWSRFVASHRHQA